MLKKTISHESQAEILKSVHIIGVLADVMTIEYSKRIIDTRFKLPTSNQHAKRIKESTEAIKRDTQYQFKVKDREFMQYEYAIEVWRLLDYFSEMGIDKIREFNDGLEKINQGEVVDYGIEQAKVEYAKFKK